MQWRVELKAKAAQAINKLDAPQRERIRAFLKKQSTQTNPRATKSPTRPTCRILAIPCR